MTPLTIYLGLVPKVRCSPGCLIGRSELGGEVGGWGLLLLLLLCLDALLGQSPVGRVKKLVLLH